jgi:hypothetical protein
LAWHKYLSLSVLIHIKKTIVMQDQNQNRNAGQQQNTGNQWQNTGDNTSNDSNDNNMEGGNPEVDYPQQPRRQEEPIVGGGQNWGTSDSPASGTRNQMNKDQGSAGSGNQGNSSGAGYQRQEGGAGSGNQQANMSDDQESDWENERSMGNSGNRMNQGSRTDQQSSKGNQSSRQSGSDDYRRNDIGQTDEEK